MSTDLRTAITLAWLAVGVVLTLSEHPPAATLVLISALQVALMWFRPTWTRGLIALNLLLVGWQCAAYGWSSFWSTHDTWMHLAIVRRIVENGLPPPDPFYLGFGAAPILSLVHVVHAVPAALGAPIDHLWRWSSPLAVVGIGAAAYFGHRELFRDRRAAAFGALYLLLWTRYSWSHATYPRSVATIFQFLSLGLLFRALRCNTTRFAVAAGVALGLSINTHPISGVMFSLVTAVMLATEWARRWRHGQGRDGARLAAAVVGGAILSSSPWLVYDGLAALGSEGTAPIIQHDVADLGRFLQIWQRRWLNPYTPLDPASPATFLWLFPLALGVVRLLGPGRDPTLVTYVASSTLLFAIVALSPLSDTFVSLFGARYTARAAAVLPLPALAAFGLVKLFDLADGRSVAMRLAGAIVLTLFLSSLLRGIEPWRHGVAIARPEKLERSELAQLEPLVRDRVVLADGTTSYLLPFYTGAYVAWNAVDHSNPWLFDRRRVRRAAAILGGRAGPAAIRDHCDRYKVEFVLLRPSAETTVRRLVESGLFSLRRTAGDLVLLERTWELP